MYRNQNSSFYCHHGQNTNEILNTKTNSVYKVNIYSLSTIVCKHGRSDEELSTYLVCSMLTVCNSYRQTQFFVVSIVCSILSGLYIEQLHTHIFVIQLMTNTSKLKRSFD